MPCLYTNVGICIVLEIIHKCTWKVDCSHKCGHLYYNKRPLKGLTLSFVSIPQTKKNWEPDFGFTFFDTQKMHYTAQIFFIVFDIYIFYCFILQIYCPQKNFSLGRHSLLLQSPHHVCDSSAQTQWAVPMCSKDWKWYNSFDHFPEGPQTSVWNGAIYQWKTRVLRGLHLFWTHDDPYHDISCH